MSANSQPRPTGTENFLQKYSLDRVRKFASHAITETVKSGDASPLEQSLHKELNDPRLQPVSAPDPATVVREQAEIRQGTYLTEPTQPRGEA
jgi:hypothetical protein